MCICLQEINRRLHPDGYGLDTTRHHDITLPPVPLLTVRRLSGERNGRDAPRVACAYCPVCGERLCPNDKETRPNQEALAVALKDR